MKQEREFLRLAGTWLACRLEVMGGVVEGVEKGPLEFSMLGCRDMAAEMRLVIGEARC